jgi:soluble lytic murein transglycosylase-like protein
MRIEATQLEQLLRLQVQPSLDIITSGEGAAASVEKSKTGDFMDMLQSLLGTDRADALAGGFDGSGGGPDLTALAGSPGALPFLSEAAAASSYAQAERHAGSPAVPRRIGGQTVPEFAVPLIEKASRVFGVDAALIASVIQTESGYRTDAVSPAGAKGLMQLMDSTSKSLGVRDPFDPEANVMGGTKYLAKLLERFGGNEGVALAAYNAGPGRIQRLGIANDEDLSNRYHLLPQETQNYVRKVLGLRAASV